MQSGICTPITSYLNQKNYQFTTLNDILTAKLRNLSSISPKSENGKRSSDSSTINFNSNISPTNSTNEQIYKVNIHPHTNNFSLGYKQFNNQLLNNQLNSSNNTMNSPNYKMMKVIRPGAKNHNNHQSYFFSKMLNTTSNESYFGNNLLNNNIGNVNLGGNGVGSVNLARNTKKNKINPDLIKKDKYEQEMKILDEDLNNSKGSELSDIKKELPPKKDKSGLWSLVSKIISK